MIASRSHFATPKLCDTLLLLFWRW